MEKAGGLPPYVERIAKHLHHDQGMTISHAIASAVNQVKRWARGGDDVKADTRAKAAAAVAQWEAKKAKTRSGRAVTMAAPTSVWSLNLSDPANAFMAPGAVWELAISSHGWVPNNPATALKWRKGSWTPPGGKPIKAADIRSRLGAKTNKDAIRILTSNPDAIKKVTGKGKRAAKRPESPLRSSGGRKAGPPDPSRGPADPTRRQTLKPNTAPPPGRSVERAKAASDADKTRAANRPAARPSTVSPDMGRQRLEKAPADSGWVAVSDADNATWRAEQAARREAAAGEVVQKSASKYKPYEVVKRGSRFYVRNTRDGKTVTSGLSKTQAAALVDIRNERARGPREEVARGVTVSRGTTNSNGRTTWTARDANGKVLPFGSTTKKKVVDRIHRMHEAQDLNAESERMAGYPGSMVRANRRMDVSTARSAARRQRADTPPATAPEPARPTIPKVPVRERPRRPVAPAGPAPVKKAPPKRARKKRATPLPTPTTAAEKRAILERYGTTDPKRAGEIAAGAPTTGLERQISRSAKRGEYVRPQDLEVVLDEAWARVKSGQPAHVVMSHDGLTAKVTGTRPPAGTRYITPQKTDSASWPEQWTMTNEQGGTTVVSSRPYPDDLLYDRKNRPATPPARRVVPTAPVRNRPRRPAPAAAPSAATPSGRRQIREQDRATNTAWTQSAQAQRARAEGRTAPPSTPSADTATPRRRGATAPRRPNAGASRTAATSTQPSGASEGALFGLTTDQKQGQKQRVVDAIDGFAPGASTAAASKLLRGEPLVRRVRDGEGDTMELSVQRDADGRWSYTTRMSNDPSDVETGSGLSLPGAIAGARKVYAETYDKPLPAATTRSRNAKASAPAADESTIRQREAHRKAQQDKARNSREAKAAREAAEKQRQAEERALVYRDPTPAAVRKRVDANASAGVPAPDDTAVQAASREYRAASRGYDTDLRSRDGDSRQARARLKAAVSALESAQLDYARRAATPMQAPQQASTTRGGIAAAKKRWQTDRRPVYMVADTSAGRAGVRVTSHKPEGSTPYAVYEGGPDWGLTRPQGGEAVRRDPAPTIGSLRRPEPEPGRSAPRIAATSADIAARQREAGERNARGQTLSMARAQSGRAYTNAKWGIASSDVDKPFIRNSSVGRQAYDDLAANRPVQALNRLRTEAARLETDGYPRDQREARALRELADRWEAKIRKPKDREASPGLTPIGQSQMVPNGQVRRRAVDNLGNEWVILLNPKTSTVRATSGRLSAQRSYTAGDNEAASQAARDLVGEMTGQRQRQDRPMVTGDTEGFNREMRAQAEWARSQTEYERLRELDSTGRDNTNEAQAMVEARRTVASMDRLDHAVGVIPGSVGRNNRNRQTVSMLDETGARWEVEYDRAAGVIWVDGPNGATGSVRVSGGLSGIAVSELVNDLKNGKRRNVRGVQR